MRLWDRLKETFKKKTSSKQDKRGPILLYDGEGRTYEIARGDVSIKDISSHFPDLSSFMVAAIETVEMAQHGTRVSFICDDNELDVFGYVKGMDSFVSTEKKRQIGMDNITVHTFIGDALNPPIALVDELIKQGIDIVIAQTNELFPSADLAAWKNVAVLADCAVLFFYRDQLSERQQTKNRIGFCVEGDEP